MASRRSSNRFGLEREQLLLDAELALQALRPDALLADVVDEAAVVVLEAVVLDLHHARHHPVEKVPIVRDENDGAADPREPAFEPREPCDVEKVGRLVEKQDVRFLEEEAGQGGPISPPPREPIDRETAMTSAEAKLAQHGVDAVLIGPAVPLLHPGGERLVSLQQAVQVCLVGFPREGVLRLAELTLDRLDVREERPEDFLHRRVAVQLGELREVADTQTVLDIDLPGRRDVAAQDQAKDRRLARSVAPDQAMRSPGSSRK